MFCDKTSLCVASWNSMARTSILEQNKLSMLYYRNKVATSEIKVVFVIEIMYSILLQLLNCSKYVVPVKSVFYLKLNVGYMLISFK